MAVKGLGAYQKSQENKSGKFLKLKDGEAVTLRFLNELDDDSPHYLTEAGTANFVTEFVHPDDFRKSFEDTREDEGDCIGYALANHYGWKKPDKDEEPEKFAAWKDWRPKQRMYINVLVNDGTNPERVEIMQLARGPKAAVANQLEELFKEIGSITNREFKYSRKGSGIYDTTYTLTQKDKDDDLPLATSYELHDLDAVVNKVSLKDQPAFVGAHYASLVGAQPATVASTPATAGEGTSVDVDW